MKTIGLIGGMSWESTVTYYQVINQTVAKKLGGMHSASILMHSLDFETIESKQRSGDWAAAGEILAAAAAGLQNAGAHLLLICANTMHKVYDTVSAAVNIPVLHIADATADELHRKKAETVALLGTRYTMQEDFYKQRLWNRGFEVLLPHEWQMEEVNRIIYDELCRGIISPSSKVFFLTLIEELAQQGAQGAILGCTEIGLLINQQDTDIPLFDTADIHARRAATLATKGVKRKQNENAK